MNTQMSLEANRHRYYGLPGGSAGFFSPTDIAVPPSQGREQAEDEIVQDDKLLAFLRSTGVSKHGIWPSTMYIRQL